MATAIQFLRSSEISLRPDPLTLSDGMPMWNSNSIDPGLYLKSNNNTLLKLGPTLVSSTAPNAAPLGYAGNCIGEMWLDTSKSSYPVLKIWDGSAWATDTTNIASLIPGTGITGAAYNGLEEQTWSVVGSSGNNPGTIVQRDAVGSFAAGTITAAFVGDLTGECTTTNNIRLSIENTDQTCSVIFATANTGVQGLRTAPTLRYDSFYGSLSTVNLNLDGKLSLANLAQPPAGGAIGDIAVVNGDLKFYSAAGWKTVTVT